MLVTQALRADVGDAVAFGVGAARARVPRDVGTERVGGTEAGALTDEDEGDLRGEREADLVADGDAALFDDADWGEFPGCERGEKFVD